MSEYCDFGVFLEEAIRDKFICGMRTNSIRRRLLTGERITLERASTLAFCLEMPSKESELMTEIK